jgi:alkanesulfonate monooxygenase SsuD/methylene tetrahydromethanopterin reductase-like flavin-dependent oxidoreductase (luciferase family)
MIQRQQLSADTVDSNALSVGILLPTREMVMSHQEAGFRQIIDLAVAAEAAGLDSAWVGDSVLARPRFEPLTTLAAVAATTREIRIGTAVLLSALRNPVLLANDIANLDLISEGRVVLGLGTAAKNAANESEFESIGIPFSKRIGIFEEGIEVIQRLWTETAVTYSGRYFNLDGVHLGLRPLRTSGVPIWLSASETRSFRRVLRYGQGWLLLAATPAAFRAAWAELQRLAADEGKDPGGLGRGVYVTLDIDHDVAAAQRRMREFVENYYGGRFEQLAQVHAVCAGPPQVCGAWLQQFIDAGANTLIVRFNQRDQFSQLRLFADQILPVLRRMT